jgi:lipoprotein-releasing system ATP-binding protein
MGDEPTGNLDKKNSNIVFDIFKELAEVYYQLLLIVTHDNEFAAHTHRIIEMEDGRIIKMKKITYMFKCHLSNLKHRQI